jgi:phytoene/squalene synthetase
MKDLSLKARQRFAAAIPPSHDHRALLPARIMRAIYEKILDRIEKNHFDLTSGPVRLKKWEKLATAAQVILMDRQIS